MDVKTAKWVVNPVDRRVREMLESELGNVASLRNATDVIAHQVETASEPVVTGLDVEQVNVSSPDCSI